MFFEPPPTQEDLTGPPHPSLPAWLAPPATELGTSMAIDRVLVHNSTVAVALSSVRAYSTGCLLNVEVVLRQNGLSPDAFWDLQMSLYPLARIRSTGGDRLPDKLLRFGVRYADGTKATTVAANADPAQEPPKDTRLSWLPGGSTLRSGRDLGIHEVALWLWPVPPAEPFEFAVEWPVGGVGLTIVELDGAPIASAARRSTTYWPSP